VNAVLDKLRCTVHSDASPFRSEVLRLSLDAGSARLSSGIGRLCLRASVWHFDPAIIQWEPVLEPVDLVVATAAAGTQDQGPDPAQAGRATAQALEALASGPEEAAVQALAAPGVQASRVGPDGLRLLDWACRRHSPALVRAVLALPGVDVNAGSEDGWCPVHWAVTPGAGPPEPARVPCPPEAGGGQGEAVDGGGPGPVGAAGPPGPPSGSDPDHEAVQGSMVGALRVLVEVGHADVNAAVASSGSTPLHLAAMHGLDGLLGYLCATPGAVLGRRNAGGLTPLEVAQMCGHAAAVEVLSGRRQPRLAALQEPLVRGCLCVRGCACAYVCVCGLLCLRSGGAAREGEYVWKVVCMGAGEMGTCGFTCIGCPSNWPSPVGQ
jgi:hypothetical protein